MADFPLWSPLPLPLPLPALTLSIRKKLPFLLADAIVDVGRQS